MKKKLGFWQSTSLVAGNMIGSGVFLLPASLAVYGGVSLIGWVVSTLGAFALAGVFAQLGKKYPKTGGPYAFARQGFGDFAGFLVAWGYWISCLCTNAAIAVAMLSYLTTFFPSLNESATTAVLIGLAAIWLLTWVNARGVTSAGWVQLITTILKLAPLILIAFVGIFYMDFSNFSPFNMSDKSTLQAITSTATLTLFAYLGLECATIPAENVENAEKVIPRATLWGTGITSIVYILGSVAVMGIIPPDTLQESEAPFADAAATIWGNSARNWVALGAIVSTFGALNGWILVQGQVPLAAAKGNLFPAIFGKTNRRNSPAIGIVISSVLVSLLIIMNFSKGFVKAFEFMILLSTLTNLLAYLFSTATYALESLQDRKKWAIILGTLAFGFSIWAVIGSGQEVVFWGFVALLLGIPFYVLMKAKDGRVEGRR